MLLICNTEEYVYTYIYIHPLFSLLKQGLSKMITKNIYMITNKKEYSKYIKSD